MASDLFNSMNTFNTNDLMKSINELKSKVSDPNAMIQQMLNSGRISQKDYNNAVLKANQIINYFGDNPNDNPIFMTIVVLYGYFNVTALNPGLIN
jgi:hypothetical protein